MSPADFGLTERHITILQGIADGRPLAAIGDQLGLRVSTLRSEIQRILRALNARNQAHAVAAAMRKGLIE